MNRFLLFRILLICSCLLPLPACQQNNAPSASILVFAAASLRDVMQEVAHSYQRRTGISVVFNFAGSNVLARQIEASPKADFFLSANPQWMDYLAFKNLIQHNSRRQFLSNNLVFIAHKDSPFELTSVQQLMTLPFRYLSIGDPQAVPAGRYAKAYLSSIRHAQENLWFGLSNRILPAPDVKAATAMVETMPDIIGVVYKTDALASTKVKVLYEPLIEDTPDIQYIGARIEKADADKISPEKIDFLTFLNQKEVATIFRKHGFITLADQQQQSTQHWRSSAL